MRNFEGRMEPCLVQSQIPLPSLDNVEKMLSDMRQVLKTYIQTKDEGVSTANQPPSTTSPAEEKADGKEKRKPHSRDKNKSTKSITTRVSHEYHQYLCDLSLETGMTIADILLPFAELVQVLDKEMLECRSCADVRESVNYWFLFEHDPKI